MLNKKLPIEASAFGVIEKENTKAIVASKIRLFGK
jgi:hypothetical protein